MDNAIKLYVKQHGDTVAGKKIEIIRKDTGGIAPDVAKRLAQELIVRDKVDILGGLRADAQRARGGGDVSAEAKKFMVMMNAATSIITTKSPYMVRTSLTTPQLNETLGTWAYKSGVRKVYTMVSDYGPGHRRGRRLPARLQGSRRRDRRLGALPGRQPGFLRLRAARQGSQPGSGSTSGCPAARSRRRSARRWPSAASTPRRPR